MKETAVQTEHEEKIGLANLSDYYFAYNDGKGTTNCQSQACKSWITPSSTEWTLTRYGLNSSDYYAWYVTGRGIFGEHTVAAAYAVRPVFYLQSSEITSGEGTQSNPYTITLN